MLETASSNQAPPHPRVQLKFIASEQSKQNKAHSVTAREGWCRSYAATCFVEVSACLLQLEHTENAELFQVLQGSICRFPDYNPIFKGFCFRADSAPEPARRLLLLVVTPLLRMQAGIFASDTGKNVDGTLRVLSTPRVHLHLKPQHVQTS